MDPDRYFCALFAPPAGREALIALYAFDSELDRIPLRVSEAMPGAIRLQWWRDTVTGAGGAAGHPVAAAMARQRSRFDPALLDRLIESREREVGGARFATLEELADHHGECSGTLVHQAAALLTPHGAQTAGPARDAGIAIGLVRMLRALPARQGAGLPRDLLVRHHLEAAGFARGVHDRRTALVVAGVATQACFHLARARAKRRRVPKEALAAFLPLAFAGRDLSTLKHNDYNVYGRNFQHNASGRQLAVLARALIRRY